MDEKIVKRFFEVSDDMVEKLKARLDKDGYLEYSDLARALVDSLEMEELSEYRRIKFGLYEGSIILIFTDSVDAPRFYAEIFYGSCPANDALENAKERAEDGDLRPLRDLLLHIVQRLKRF